MKDIYINTALNATAIRYAPLEVSLLLPINMATDANCKKNKVNFDCIQKFFYLASLKEVSVHIKNKNNNQKGKENKSYFINYS